MPRLQLLKQHLEEAAASDQQDGKQPGKRFPHDSKLRLATRKSSELRESQNILHQTANGWTGFQHHKYI